MSEDNASLYVHPEVRLRIAQRSLIENASRIYELCAVLNLDPDSLTPDWTIESYGITDEVIESAKNPIRLKTSILSGGNTLERLVDPAMQLEKHIKVHSIMLKKYNDVAQEKNDSPRDWTIGHFHWCPDCDYIYGDDGKIGGTGLTRSMGYVTTCPRCGHSGKDF